jgi:hypothetical protein
MAWEHMISLPATGLQTYHMFASLTILVDPLANTSLIANQVLMNISYVCKPAREPALAPMQKLSVSP